MEGKDKGNIVGNILGNNRKAQMAFYDDYAKMLYATCFRILGNREEAEEAMQDSFLKIFESIGTQYVENGTLEAWMRRIASHTAIDYLRRSKPEWDFLSEDLPDEPEADVDETFLDRSVDEIKAAMNRLAEEYPAYHWDENKGYPTRAHREAIRMHGITPYHRKTFTLLPEQLELKF